MLSTTLCRVGHYSYSLTSCVFIHSTFSDRIKTIVCILGLVKVNRDWIERKSTNHFIFLVFAFDTSVGRRFHYHKMSRKDNSLGNLTSRFTNLIQVRLMLALSHDGFVMVAFESHSHCNIFSPYRAQSAEQST